MGNLVERIRICPLSDRLGPCPEGMNYKDPRCERDYKHCRIYKTVMKNNELIF